VYLPPDGADEVHDYPALACAGGYRDICGDRPEGNIFSGCVLHGDFQAWHDLRVAEHLAADDGLVLVNDVISSTGRDGDFSGTWNHDLLAHRGADRGDEAENPPYEGGTDRKQQGCSDEVPYPRWLQPLLIHR
jgi:hypothetical protein